MTTSAYNEPSAVAEGFLASAFRLLHDGIIPFMRTVLGVLEAKGYKLVNVPDLNALLEAPDLNPLLKAWVDNGRMFEEKSFDGREAPNVGTIWPRQVQTFRNERWAHQGSYSEQEVVDIIRVMYLWLDEIVASSQAEEVKHIVDQLDELILIRNLSRSGSDAANPSLSVAEKSAGLNVGAFLAERSGSEEVRVLAEGFIAQAWRRLGEGLGPVVAKITGYSPKRERDVSEILGRVVANNNKQKFEKAGYDIYNPCRGLKDHRNVWAHQGNCDHHRAISILGLAEAVLNAVDAVALAEEIGQMTTDLRNIWLESRQRGLDKDSAPTIMVNLAELRGQIILLAEPHSLGLQPGELTERTPTSAARPADPIESPPPVGTSVMGPHAIIAECDDLIRRFPDDAAAYIRRGRAYGSLGEFETAAADIAEAKRLAPHIERDLERAETLAHEGEMALRQGLYKQAIQRNNRALELNPRHVTAYNNRGAAHAFAGNFDEAIRDFTTAIKLDGKSASHYSNRSGAYNKIGEYRQAIEDATTAIEIDDNYASAFANSGIAHFGVGCYWRAIEDFSRAIDLDENYASVYYDRGLAFGSAGEHSRAIEDFSQVIQFNASDTYAYLNRGVYYQKNGDYDSAISDLTSAIEIDKNFADAYRNRGVLYGHIGEFERGIADSTRAIEINDSLADAYLNRGVLYAETDDYERAMADFISIIEKATEKDENFAKAHLNRGILYCENGDYEQAIANFTEAIGVAEYSFDAYMLRAEACIEIDDYERAIEDFTSVIAMDGNSTKAHFRRGIAHATISEYQLAIDDFQRTRELAVDHDQFQQALSNALEDLIKLRDALADCDSMIEEHPDDPDGWHLRGLIWLDNEAFDLAIANFDEALRLGPDNAEARTHLGLAHSGAGDYDQAFASYDRALQSNPDFALAHYQRGRIWQMRAEYSNAIIDFSQVIRLKPDYPPAYQNRGICHLRMGQEDQARADFDAARDTGFEP